MDQESDEEPETALEALRRWTLEHGTALKGLQAPACNFEDDEDRIHPLALEFERISDEEATDATRMDDMTSMEALASPGLHMATSSEVDMAYQRAKKEFEATPHVLEAVDLDGWTLETSQLQLVEETEEDIKELKILLSCCQHEKNRQRLRQAISEFQVQLRSRRTWGWFPLERFQWSGFEYEKPLITLDFHVPGVGSLPPEDVHCDFGVDWFDLKVWNVEWPQDPGVKYHHRVKKTRLMRDIVPCDCSVEAQGDHLYVKLQKIKDPRHGYCAWSDLSAGRGRKPFKYQEDAQDGGLMDFLEGEYEKYEGYDGFRRDVGQAMEQVHRHQPVRGFD
ncbi:unnamed protein product [Cladocopium goreaui]|uniref:CS domain-containing protein n=1 Tax=Cladocopium goreaui TaxID=2562237 RepID=A0A9P1C1R5_9DINO|nr:unnamed protein product [Cladocopium goreaui]